MKYKKHILEKVLDSDIERGYCVEIYKDNKYITTAPDFSNAKEFVSSFNGTDYDWNVLC